MWSLPCFIDGIESNKITIEKKMLHRKNISQLLDGCCIPIFLIIISYLKSIQTIFISRYLYDNDKIN